MSRLLVGFLLVWCSALAGAQEVTFRTVPSGTPVYDQYGQLGTSGQPLVLRPPSAYQGVVQLVFRSPGYKDLVLSVPYPAIIRPDPDRSYPPSSQSPLYLEPASPLAYLSYYRGSLLLLLGLGAVGGAAWTRLRRREQRVERVEALLGRDATASMVEKLPGRLGPYQVLGKLGGGGMATVYRALAPDGQEVALKVLQKRSEEDTDFEARFRREAGLYLKLRHPHIVQMLDYGQEGELVYLVLELMDGGTLTRRIPPQGMPTAEAARLLEPLGAAVQAAHDQGVVHRDLKPDNVMLTGRGTLKVTDFGLGRSLTSTYLTVTGTALGTPAYMSPEQICGTHYEPATDQYALGVMAFEILTGRRPFEAADPMQACFMHVSEPPPAPGISPAVDEVVLRMLAKKPEERYPSVKDATRALLDALG